MAITRKFLDWERPALPQVVDFLIEQYDVLGVVDLQDVVAVVPGGRARRRLLELLAEKAGSTHHPPRVVTPEGLPELLYDNRQRFAPELVQKLAWANVLRSTPAEELAAVVPRPPEPDAFEQWLSLGELIWSQHRELARDGFDFADVATRGVELEGFEEEDRWWCLHRLQEAYHAALDDLSLWDEQSARLFAIKHEECRANQDVVLVATSDLNTTLRQMLDQVSEKVTALVHAPIRLQKRFDAYGCLVPEAWMEVPIEIDESTVRVVDGPAEQADEVARVLAGYDGRYRPDEITVGVPDEAIVPQVERQLLECGVASRWVVGITLGETAPFRLLEAVADRLDAKRFDTFAALVRHPDVHDWLGEQGVEPEWLAILDRYYTRRLQAELGDWTGTDGDDAIVRRVDESIAALLAPLDPQGNDPRPLEDWTGPIVDLLLAVYVNVEFDRDDATDRIVVDATRLLHTALVEHTEVPESLMPVTSAATAIRLALDRTRNELLPPLPDEDAVEILGWLELPLDDAEALVLTSFNEGFVPKSVNSHLFLPNALRKLLGLLDNDRRYARDAYATSAILASRERVDLIVARRDARSDPLAPSRLLFATKPDAIAHRVLDFLEPRPAPPPIIGSLSPGREETELYVPRPRKLELPVERMSVTAFRTYRACPYRFYLRHVLRLDEVDDTAEELDGGMFGTLMHDVLADFGQSELRDSIHAEEIGDFLHVSLERHVEETLGSGRRAPVNVQLEQMKVRFAGFADWQARWRRQGWRIEFVEEPEFGQTIAFPGDGQPSVQLVGRVDRIDRHEGEDRWVVFDYKTGESAKAPERVHQFKGEWVDLQLPLYRHLVRPLGVTGDVRLGFITLSKNVDEIRERIAIWSDDELRHADEVAAGVVRDVLNEVFWPPQPVPDTYFTEFAGICQDGVLDRRWEPERASGAEGVDAEVRGLRAGSGTG